MNLSGTVMRIQMRSLIVLEGKMGIEFEDETVELEAGEMIVVPKGKKHKPFSEKEAKIMLVETKRCA